MQERGTRPRSAACFLFGLTNKTLHQTAAQVEDLAKYILILVGVS